MTHPMYPEVELDPSTPPVPPTPSAPQPPAVETELPPEPPQVEPEPQEEPEDVVDVLQPKAEVKVWAFGPEGQLKYTQRPLSYFAKMQWFSLVGDVVQKTLSGQDGVSINNLLSAPGRPGELSMADFRDADTFVQAVGKLLVAAPDFLVRSYCIWLGVPDYQREIVSDAMAAPPELGGLTDEQGIEIIEVFIDQNYQALDDFFREGLGGLFNRVQRRAAESASRRSKR